MIRAVPDILAEIVEYKRTSLSARRSRLSEMERRAETSVRHRRDFAAALTANSPAIIAEIKKASPSRGLLCPDFHPQAIAQTYAAGGAAALSVLTDERYFQGSLQDLVEARSAVDLPVLRKDFVIDEADIVEAAAHGADAVLLIAAVLRDGQLRQYRELATEFRMSALVEVHDAAELLRAVQSGAEIIGVNNRDLRSFEVRLETALQLAEEMPPGAIRVAESGIHTPDDIARLREAGYNAFLIGEHLVKSADAAAALRDLRS